MNRTYVDVECICLVNGTVVPKRVIWRDGRSWDIVRVIHSCTSVGGEFDGIRYTVLIGKSEKQIYFTKGRWYVEETGREEAS